MCFAKSVVPTVEQQEPVVRHQADAQVTKNSNNKSNLQGYKQNFKTTPLGLVQDINSEKKTLLGE